MNLFPVLVGLVLLNLYFPCRVLWTIVYLFILSRLAIVLFVVFFHLLINPFRERDGGWNVTTTNGEQP